MHYWMRVGDQGDYAPYDDLDAVIADLNEWRVGEVTGWVNGGIGVGLETTECYGYDFISLFWGDNQANLIRPLDAEERAAMSKTSVRVSGSPPVMMRIGRANAAMESRMAEISPIPSSSS